MDETGIRRRPDGSIDTGYYISRGRQERAKQARRLALSATEALRQPTMETRAGRQV